MKEIIKSKSNFTSIINEITAVCDIIIADVRVCTLSVLYQIQHETEKNTAPLDFRKSPSKPISNVRDIYTSFEAHTERFIEHFGDAQNQ